MITPREAREVASKAKLKEINMKPYLRRIHRRIKYAAKHGNKSVEIVFEWFGSGPLDLIVQTLRAYGYTVRWRWYSLDLLLTVEWSE